MEEYNQTTTWPSAHYMAIPSFGEEWYNLREKKEAPKTTHPGFKRWSKGHQCLEQFVISKLSPTNVGDANYLDAVSALAPLLRAMEIYRALLRWARLDCGEGECTIKIPEEITFLLLSPSWWSKLAYYLSVLPPPPVLASTVPVEEGGLSALEHLQRLNVTARRANAWYISSAATVIKRVESGEGTALPYASTMRRRNTIMLMSGSCALFPGPHPRRNKEGAFNGPFVVPSSSLESSSGSPDSELDTLQPVLSAVLPVPSTGPGMAITTFSCSFEVH